MTNNDGKKIEINDKVKPFGTVWKCPTRLIMSKETYDAIKDHLNDEEYK